MSFALLLLLLWLRLGLGWAVDRGLWPWKREGSRGRGMRFRNWLCLFSKIRKHAVVRPGCTAAKRRAGHPLPRLDPQPRVALDMGSRHWEGACTPTSTGQGSRSIFRRAATTSGKSEPSQLRRAESRTQAYATLTLTFASVVVLSWCTSSSPSFPFFYLFYTRRIYCLFSENGFSSLLFER